MVDEERERQEAIKAALEQDITEPHMETTRQERPQADEIASVIILMAAMVCFALLVGLTGFILKGVSKVFA